MTLDDARDLDRADPLAPYRAQFAPIEDELIYLDGNSLGRLPIAASERAKQVVEQWGSSLVRGWGEGWYELPLRLGAKVARLIGAQEDEVIVCDSTSVNLYKLISAALRMQDPRQEVVTDDANFPSDLYVMQGAFSPPPRSPSLPSGRDSEARTQPRGDGEVGAPDPWGEGVLKIVPSGEEGELRDAVSPETALVSLSHTSFKSAEIYDIGAITRLAHSAGTNQPPATGGQGALMLWDLSHSVGAMPIELNKHGVDLAVGCTYKYLNGGPGSPAFLYVRRDLQDKLLSPIQGWFGQKAPFDFGLEYDPAPGIRRFLAGTPPILSMATMEPGIDMILEAGLDAIRAKSEKLTAFLIELFDQELAPLGVILRTPRDAKKRGSHVALAHPQGWRINRALIEDVQVVPDFRQPDNIRLGLAPLYTTFEEVFEAVHRLKRVVAERIYEKYPAERAAVT